MAVTREWRVYGTFGGHRQKMSFLPSFRWDFSEGENIRIVEVDNADKTNTNEYSVLRITRNTEEECEREMWAQVDDGAFENYRHGEIVEIIE